MKELQFKNIINDEEEKDEQSELIINNEDNLGNGFIEGKSNNFKIKLIKSFNYFEDHYILNAFIKLFFGIIILILPFICIIFFNIINFGEKNKYIVFPYFISLCIMIGSLMILLVIKIGEACQMHGIAIYVWERKNIFKIINSIIIGFHLLWIFFIFEKFPKAYNLLKEKVAQAILKERSSKLFSRGSYTLRILFILFFWETEKDQYGNYIYELLGYFEYEESVLTEFHGYIKSLMLPILFLNFYILFKIIIFKNRKQFSLLLLNLLILIQSFYLFFYPIKKEEDNVFNESYFSNTECKYAELSIYVCIILLLIFESFKKYILNLIRKKYYSKKNKNKNLIIIIIIISSFLINLTGYILSIYLFFIFAFDKIDDKLKIQRYHFYWMIIYLAISFILLGYSFLFGHFCFNLIYYPISYEISPHSFKNEFYTKCSGKLIESENNSNFRYSKKSVDYYIS